MTAAIDFICHQRLGIGALQERHRRHLGLHSISLASPLRPSVVLIDAVALRYLADWSDDDDTPPTPAAPAVALRPAA